MSSAGGDFTWHEVGARIRDMRLARGISQAQLAKDAELSPPGLFAIEKGDINPQLNSLQRIAKVLGSTVRELLVGSKAKPRAEFDEFFEHARYVLESRNEVAVLNLLNGLETARLIMRSGVDTPSPIFRRYESEPGLPYQTIFSMPGALKRRARRKKGQK